MLFKRTHTICYWFNIANCFPLRIVSSFVSCVATALYRRHIRQLRAQCVWDPILVINTKSVVHINISVHSPNKSCHLDNIYLKFESFQKWSCVALPWYITFENKFEFRKSCRVFLFFVVFHGWTSSEDFPIFPFSFQIVIFRIISWH